MIDFVKLHIKAGDGGDGRISFFRSRYQPKGGPDGGDGGAGGSVVVEASVQLHTLRDYAGKQQIEAGSGKMGGKTNMHGANEPDIHLKLPVGTKIWSVVETHKSVKKKRMYRVDQEQGRIERPLDRSKLKIKIQEKEGVFELRGKRSEARGKEEERYEFQEIEEFDEPETLPAVPAVDPKTHSILHMGSQEYVVQLVGELIKDGQQFVVARGGKGGKGNEQFKSSRNTTPMEAETGEDGESGDYIFELQTLADIGLIGFPNAGKSTLLSVLTKANPKIANYPFTTLEPNLGVLTFEADKFEQRGSILIADIPGIIEGAHEGKGIGLEFLRHIARCRVLIFVLALDAAEFVDHLEDSKLLTKQLKAQYKTLQGELSSYAKTHQSALSGESDIKMEQKRQLIVLNKADLFSKDSKKKIQKEMKSLKQKTLWTSGVTGEGIEELKNLLRELAS